MSSDPTGPRKRTKYVAPRVMAESRWIAIRAALRHLRTCHDDYADCHPSNHPKWEGEALMRLEMALASMLSEEAGSE